MKATVDQPRTPESKAKNPEPRLASKPDFKDDLKSLPMPEVEKRLGSSENGLSQAEAQKRLAKYGPNEIKEKKNNLFLKFLSYFWGPIPWMIEGAVILSGVVRHWLDFFIILFLLFSNAVVAFWEEHQAGNEIAALRAKLATKARALRDGKWATPKVAELVPGDVIRLLLGDIVPADARLLAGDPVQVDQSALTGESLPAGSRSGLVHSRRRWAESRHWCSLVASGRMHPQFALGFAMGLDSSESNSKRSIMRLTRA
jgi:H+-transporting ATPase